MPSADRKSIFSIKRPRLFPFSKIENQIILGHSGDKKVHKFIKNVFTEGKELKDYERNYNIFLEEFKKRSSFSYATGVSVYGEINGNPTLKMMVLLDFLTDFAEDRGLNIKYTLFYYQILRVLIEVKGVTIQKAMALILGF